MREEDNRSVDRLNYSQKWSGSLIANKKRRRFAVCVRLREGSTVETAGKIDERRRPTKANFGF
jgi:hypothetical protein